MRLRTIAEWLVILIPLFIVCYAGWSVLVPYGPSVFADLTKSDQISGPARESGLFQEALPSAKVFSEQKADWQYTLTAKFRYTIVGKVAGKREYHETGPGQVAPMDICVASGDVIRPEYFPYFSFTQGYRNCFFHYSYPRGVTMPSSRYISEHISNNHLVFSDPALMDTARKLKMNDCFTLTGYLVDISGIRNNQETFTWVTSTSRSDSFPNGCEIIYVESLEQCTC